MRIAGWMVCGSLLVLAAGCPSQSPNQANPFLTAAENYGTASTSTQGAGGTTGGGTSASSVFRAPLTLTLANTSATQDLNVLFVAWVSASSIRSADQQDDLLRDGYIQLSREVQFGSAFRLPPGTFVYSGPGAGGATPVLIRAAGFADAANGVAADPREKEFTLITPDAILLFDDPPVSCDSVAFHFTEDGVSPDEGFNNRSTGSGNRKTLAQVDVYQCDPFHPGLFFKSGGGARLPNEYFEGESIRVEFSTTENASGAAAVVTFLGSTSAGDGSTIP